eukprot:TRINITY_DN13625_c0_g1_i1.p1 TRINITY_DN13625_c0_g1~~TRINITY_DN13625_c0_g1_i1.p1  ORF type:complete len:127 (+),score=16.93 TRINITY_DN13625_c0_g1_i1:246-626(+)
MLDDFYLNGIDCLKYSEAVTGYIDVQREALKTNWTSFLASMIPCARLWPWIAGELWKLYHDKAEANVYAWWWQEQVNDKGVPDYHSAEKLESYVNQDIAANPSLYDEVQKYYELAMKSERNLFTFW